MKYKKISYFYRTREQFEDLVYIIQELERSAILKKSSGRYGYMSPSYASVKSPDYTNQGIRKRIPKKRPGRKKYTATVGFEEEFYVEKKDEFEKKIERLNLEPVSSVPNKPKFNEDELTSEFVVLKSPEHFKKLTSVLNSLYGHGNWHLRGARRILPKLLEAAEIKASVVGGYSVFSHNKHMKEIVENGLKVKVVVHSKVDNLKKALFKIQLMT